MEQARNIREAIAANVRALRGARGLSLGDLAATSGTGKATLSRIEAGQANPTIETLYALADALGVPLGALTAARPASVQHLRAAELPRVGGAVEARVLTQITAGALVEALEIAFPAGEVRSSQPHPAGVVEHLVLTRGRLRAGPVGATVALDPGDVLRFSADVPHEYAALDDAPAGAMILMAYPPSAASFS